MFLIDIFKRGSHTEVESTRHFEDRAKLDSFVQWWLVQPEHAGKHIVVLEEGSERDEAGEGPMETLWEGTAGVHQYAHP